MGLHYNIQIDLPATRDSAIYDAIFKSLKEHILGAPELLVGGGWADFYG